MVNAVQHIAALKNQTGEGPLWSPAEKALYWVDIPGHAFYRLDSSSGQHQKFEMGFSIGAIGFAESGRLVMATKRGFALFDLTTQHLTWLGDPKGDKSYLRFNDGKVDRQGRFWAGTMFEEPSEDKTGAGCLYRLDPAGSIHLMEQGLFISNGIGWSPDNRTMYLTASTPQVLYAYDFDPVTGNISRRRPFVQYPATEGAAVPDGLTVDSEGYIWSASWGGWKVMRYDPQGHKVAEIKLPTQCPSSCAFGGADLNELYITSATSGLNTSEQAAQPFAGELFRVKVAAKGLLEPKFNDEAL